MQTLCVIQVGQSARGLSREAFKGANPSTFRIRGPYQWQAQVRKMSQPLQTKTFETRAMAEQWARAIEVETGRGVFVSRAEAETVSGHTPFV